MRALLQRVSQAQVLAEGSVIGEIGPGLTIFLGVGRHDTETTVEKFVNKILALRIFADNEGRMNLSVSDAGGGLLIVSQFTLYADTGSGNRPSFMNAAAPTLAEELYEYFVVLCRKRGFKVATGKFRAHMQVTLVNDGPVTIMLDSEPNANVS